MRLKRPKKTSNKRKIIKHLERPSISKLISVLLVTGESRYCGRRHAARLVKGTEVTEVDNGVEDPCIQARVLAIARLPRPLVVAEGLCLAVFGTVRNRAAPPQPALVLGNAEVQQWHEKRRRSLGKGGEELATR